MPISFGASTSRVTAGIARDARITLLGNTVAADGSNGTLFDVEKLALGDDCDEFEMLGKAIGALVSGGLVRTTGVALPGFEGPFDSAEGGVTLVEFDGAELIGVVGDDGVSGTIFGRGVPRLPGAEGDAGVPVLGAVGTGAIVGSIGAVGFVWANGAFGIGPGGVAGVEGAFTGASDGAGMFGVIEIGGTSGSGFGSDSTIRGGGIPPPFPVFAVAPVLAFNDGGVIPAPGPVLGAGWASGKKTFGAGNAGSLFPT